MSIFATIEPHLSGEKSKKIREFLSHFEDFTLEQWKGVLTKYDSLEIEVIDDAEIDSYLVAKEFLDTLGLPTTEIIGEIIRLTYPPC